MARKCDVLIADDDPSTSKITRGWVELTGRKTHLANNARKALAILKAHPTIRVLVTIMPLPIVDGNSLIRRVLEVRSDLGIIVLADAADIVDNPDRCEIIRMPFHPMELEHALEVACERGTPEQKAA